MSLCPGAWITAWVQCPKGLPYEHHGIVSSVADGE